MSLRGHSGARGGAVKSFRNDGAIYLIKESSGRLDSVIRVLVFRFRGWAQTGSENQVYKYSVRNDQQPYSDRSNAKPLDTAQI